MLRGSFGASSSVLEGSNTANALCRCRVDLEPGALLDPLSSLGVRHLTNNEFTGGDLFADVLEFRLSGLFGSLPTRLRHLRSLGSFPQFCAPAELKTR